MAALFAGSFGRPGPLGGNTLSDISRFITGLVSLLFLLYPPVQLFKALICERSYIMFRHVLPLALPATLVVLLAACGAAEEVKTLPRPAMVVQPQPAGESAETYPGEVRARLEQDLAFRIGGKVSKRLVDVGQRVQKDQPLAELDPQDVRLQLEAQRAQVAAASANLQLVRSERDRYKTLFDRQMASRSQYDNAENLYRAGEARSEERRV